jgi:hypothetical protein
MERKPEVVTPQTEQENSFDSMLTEEGLITIHTKITMTKQAYEDLQQKCEESYCTIHDAFQACIDEEFND